MKTPSYIKIFNTMSSGEWVDFTKICNPFVGGKEADRRLRFMRQMGWVNFEWRYRPGTHTPQYRFTQINQSWWEYYRQHSLTRVGEHGQVELVI